MQQRQFLKIATGMVFLLTAMLIFSDIMFAQCTPLGSWSRRLTGSYYTWGWDGNTNAADISGSGGVREAMRAAVSKWVSAANANGTRITIDENTADPGSADIKFIFQDLGWGGNIVYGQANGNTIFINSNSNVKWTTYDYQVPQRVDLNSLVVHEMGHVFLSGGHTSDNSSVMRSFNSGEVLRNLSSCDQTITLDFYNPPYTVTVKNSFGGGDVKIDGTTYNIPASSDTFTWRASTFPHSLEAINRQSYGGYVWLYKDWTSSQGLQDATNPQPAQVPSSSSVTYTANFEEEFNVTFQNSFVGGGGGGIIKVNGSVYNSPHTEPVRRGNSINGEALYPVVNSIQYTFDHWWDGNTTASRTFTPGDHATLHGLFHRQAAACDNYLELRPSRYSGANRVARTPQHRRYVISGLAQG